MAGAAPVIFDPNQPISATNQPPSVAISQLSTIGVPAGVSYNATPYSAPGISAIVGFAPEGIATGNPASVLPSVIVRAG
jgi:hypothetical protein